MGKLSLLVAESSDLPQSSADQIMYWEEREMAKNVFSLPALLDSRLLEIRAEHMRWAYEMGNWQPDGAGETLEQLLTCGEPPSMWWTSLLYERHPKLSPNLYIIYKLRRLEMFLLENKVEELAVYGPDNQLADTIQNMCSALRIKFSIMHARPQRERESLLRRIYYAMPSPVRALARFCHWWLKIKRHMPFCDSLTPLSLQGKNAATDRTATIISYFPNIDLEAAGKGRFRSRYWENLHDLLNAEAKKERPDGDHFVRWLFIRFPSPQLTLEQCLDLRSFFNREGRDGKSFNYLEEFLSFSDMLASLRRWFKLCAVSMRAQKSMSEQASFKNSQLNFWPYIQKEWAESCRGWRCLERCLQNRAFWRYVQIAGPQRWTLFPLENCPWERMATCHAHALKDNGPVFGAQHSIIRPSDFRYFDDPRTFMDNSFAILQPDVIGGNGRSAMEQWLAAGMPKDRPRQLEALRYQYLIEQQPGENVVNPQNSLPPFPGEPLEMPAKHRLLVLTSFFEDETHTHLDLLAKTLEAGFLGDWQIDIKPHPYLPVNDWLSRQPEKWRNKIRIVDGPLASVMKTGITVWASNSTTAALEAVLKDLPVMVMAPRKDFDLCPIQNVPGLARTACVEDVKQGLARGKSPELPHDYLDLSPCLTAWSQLLDIVVDSACDKDKMA